MPRTRSILVRLAIVVAFSVPARPTRADGAPAKAAAEALYQVGKRLMQQGQYLEACPKLAASQQLDPGVGTLLLLGECQERAGNLASAWLAFERGAALARSHADPERAAVAELRAVALQPRLSAVAFDVGTNAQLPGFELRRAGHVVAQGTWGVSVPIDPGSYEITASAPHRQTWRSNVSVPAEHTEPLTIQVPPLLQLSGSIATPRTPGDPVSLPPPSPRRTVAEITIVAGGASALVAGIVGYLALQKNRDSKVNCEQNPNLCNPTGVQQRSDAQKLANIATYVGLGSAVILGAGTLIYFSVPRANSGGVTGFSLGVSSHF
jgi:hypothetical protein